MTKHDKIRVESLDINGQIIYHKYLMLKYIRSVLKYIWTILKYVWVWLVHGPRLWAQLI